MKRSWVPLLLGALLLAGCGRKPAPPAMTPADFAGRTWESVLAEARGATVQYAMWAGDEGRNRYFQGPVAETLRERYGITLRIVPCDDVAVIVNKLLNEKGAGRAADGSVDLVWINGENFRTARQADLLWGPFADALPNIRFYPAAARERDFGTPIEGYEAPWQRAQFVLAYDAARVPAPPRSIEGLRDWIRAHPGRFTYLAPPDFTGSVFLRHILLHFAGSDGLQGGFDEDRYQRAAAPALAYLNEIRPFLWRRGETYPASPKEADRLFANNEIDFTMSYGPSFASERIARGEYPTTTRTFVFEGGTIGNYSYLAIPFNAAHPAGALVVANHLMSFEHAMAQGRALGSLFPLSLDALGPEARAAAESLPRGPATLSAAELAAHQRPEPDARYVDRLEKDWREKVLQR